MRLAAIVMIAILVTNLRADEPPAKPISVADAAKKVDAKVTVEMEVKSTGGKSSYYLNSETDFRDDKNFTIFIPRDAVEKFKQAKIENPADHFKGKTIQVTGTVVLYQKKPQIKVDRPEQIKIVEKKQDDPKK
jgi:DNA/RNA endonuclease YhcR with UshA esterase domain